MVQFQTDTLKQTGHLASASVQNSVLDPRRGPTWSSHGCGSQVTGHDLWAEVWGRKRRPEDRDSVHVRLQVLSMPSAR